MRLSRAGRAILLLSALVVVLPLGVYGATTLPLVVDIYDAVVDEHDTIAFYNNGTTGCSGLNSDLLAAPAIVGDGDVPGPTDAYDFDPPWTLASGLSSTSYVDGSDCLGVSCIRAQFNSNRKIMSLDTRGTVGPRRVTISFAVSCGLADGCPGPAGSEGVFGGTLATPVLVNVFLDSPYTGMGVCSTRECPEARLAFAKLWFVDPAAADVTWRIDWWTVRVLRMDAATWYFIADECDGTQIAGLSKLTGSRTRPKTVFNGYYKIPFFLAARQ